MSLRLNDNSVLRQWTVLVDVRAHLAVASSVSATRNYSLVEKIRYKNIAR